MTPPRARSAAAPQTTRVRLQSIIKESRNIMRKDAGLNGELDRLPQLAWLLFLRALDEVELDRSIKHSAYRPAVLGKYRWSEWARGDKTGGPLLTFVNDELLPHLKGLRGSGAAGDPRDTVAAIFENVTNRMLSGFLLKDLVAQLDRVDFANADDLHTMAHLYESMLKEMRDAAGDSGEFYTPRPLVRFMTRMVDPRPGETVLDPAMGTGGFLVEAFEHMLAAATTAQRREKVQAGIRGTEKKSMPFLLAQMNFLLHGLDRPKVAQANALANPIVDMRRDGVNVVLTNPPFGGEEERGVLSNFPSGMQTAETVWLFLQAVMARLERQKGSRCAIVVPNSVLFDKGIGARVKAELMTRFNLHTVLRMPNGVFAPYTLIPSNILFFERGQQSEHIWFYEHPLPKGRKNYTKTGPLAYEEFAPCEAWWGGAARQGRVETERAWRVAVADVVAEDYDLDRRNPNRPDDLAHRPPAELIAELIETERDMLALLEQLKHQIRDFAR